MKKSNELFPQTKGLFLTEGGMETVIIYCAGIELASFAAIDLMRRPEGPDIIKAYFKPYLEIAKMAGAGFIMDTPTWRASPDWAIPVGFANIEELADANRRGISITTSIRNENHTQGSPVLVSGTVGPRGDGYTPGYLMSPKEAETYHSWLMSIFAGSNIDFVSALTMTNANEAIGIVRAAQAKGFPVVISFTVETDAKLPDGTTLKDAIERTDKETNRTPAYYMINCAHPSHFSGMLLEAEGDWVQRIGGIRANASRKSHAELDCSCELDDGNPAELGSELADMRMRMPQLNVLGGCCGTDDRHIAEIAKSVLQHQNAA